MVERRSDRRDDANCRAYHRNAMTGNGLKQFKTMTRIRMATLRLMLVRNIWESLCENEGAYRGDLRLPA